MKIINLVLFMFTFSAFISDKPYKDGSYDGMSRSYYTSEPYYGFTLIEIGQGRIKNVNFYIRDSVKHEFFNEQYAKYFAGNEVYLEQCRKDNIGIRSYPDSLLKYQDLKKVDVISGATWSYNIFKASAEEALKKATE